MQIQEFKNLRLVGGTSLALQIGHRKSIDIDLFGNVDFRNINLEEVFKDFNDVKTLSKSVNINIFSIEGIKVDFVNYTYKWLKPKQTVDNIRLASIEDIAAMKLSDIMGRGSRKDFLDIYFLLLSYSFKELVEFYNQKYHDGSEFLLLKSLSYFEDADNDIRIENTKGVSWPEIEKSILNDLEVYIRSK